MSNIKYVVVMTTPDDPYVVIGTFDTVEAASKYIEKCKKDYNDECKFTIETTY